MKKQTGFTLIELMVVMSIVALLMGMVGSLAINSVDKAKAKEELLTVQNWLKKLSSRAYFTGQAHNLVFSGKQASLYTELNSATPLKVVEFEFLFFQPQTLFFNGNGFVTPTSLHTSYRNQTVSYNLTDWVNGEINTNEAEHTPVLTFSVAD